MAGGVLQAHFLRIVELMADTTPAAQVAAVGVVAAALRQGLAHPSSCIVGLLALEGYRPASPKEPLGRARAEALRAVAAVYSAEPTCVTSRFGAGVRAAFAHAHRRGEARGVAAGPGSPFARLYGQLQCGGTHRRELLDALLGPFKESAAVSDERLQLMRWSCLVVAGLPMVREWEPLHVVLAADRIASMQVASLLDALEGTADRGDATAEASLEARAPASADEVPTDSSRAAVAFWDLHLLKRHLKVPSRALPGERSRGESSHPRALVLFCVAAATCRALQEVYGLSDARCRQAAVTGTADQSRGLLERNADGPRPCLQLPDAFPPSEALSRLRDLLQSGDGDDEAGAGQGPSRTPSTPVTPTKGAKRCAHGRRRRWRRTPVCLTPGMGSLRPQEVSRNRARRRRQKEQGFHRLPAVKEP